MIHGIEQGTLPGLRGGSKDLEVALGGRIQKQGLAIAVLLYPPEVSGFSPQDVLSINENCSGRSECRMSEIDPKTLQIHHPKALHDLPRAGTLIEVKPRPLGYRNFTYNTLKLVLENRAQGQGSKVFVKPFAHKDLLGRQRVQDGKEVMRKIGLRQGEFTGREIEPGSPGSFLVKLEGKEKMVSISIQLPILQNGSRCQNPRNPSLDQLPGLGRLELIANGHFVSKIQ